MHHFYLQNLCVWYKFLFAFADSALAFTKVLKKLEDFTLPSGDAMLNKWIAAIKAGNKHFNAGDLKALGQVGHSIVPILRGILPAIPDENVHAAIEGLADQFEKDLDSSVTAGTAPLSEMDKFFRHAAQAMLSAMSKGTPTAETLN